jgi:hypothetical protein
VHAPQEVVRLLGCGRLLEALHAHALRVHAVEHAADGAVLAPGIERLQHHEQAVLALGVERLLQFRELFVECLDALARLVLVEVEGRAVVGVVVAQVDLAPGLDAIAVGC